MHGFARLRHGLHHAHAASLHEPGTVRRFLSQPALWAVLIAAAVLVILALTAVYVPVDAGPDEIPFHFYPVY